MTREIRVVAILEAKSGKAKEVEQILKACVAPSRAEAGCRFYTLHVDLENTQRFVFVERWADQAAIDFHKKTDHYLAMASAAADLLLDRQVLLLNEIDVA